MHITEGFNQPRAAAVSVGGFIRRHNRASIAVAVGLGIVGPLPPAATEELTDDQSIATRR